MPLVVEKLACICNPSNMPTPPESILKVALFKFGDGNSFLLKPVLSACPKLFAAEYFLSLQDAPSVLCANAVFIEVEGALSDDDAAKASSYFSAQKDVLVFVVADSMGIKRAENFAAKIGTQEVFAAESLTAHVLLRSVRSALKTRDLERRLEHVDMRFRQMTALTLDGVTEMDDAGRFLFVSPSHGSVFGHASESLIGRDCLEFIHPEDLAGTKAWLNKISTGAGGLVEFRYRHVAGHYLWVEAKGHVFSGYADGDKRILLNWHEITHRKESETTLRESQERLRAVLEGVNEYIYHAEFRSGECVYRYHSPKCEAITGYTQADYESDANLWFSMIYEDDRPAFQRFLLQIRSKSGSATIEHRISHKNGSVRWILNTCSVVHNQAGELISETGFLMDITAQKEYEESLRKFSSAVEQSGNTIVITNKQGEIEYANPKALMTTGYTFDELAGKNPRVLKSGEQPAAFYKELWKTLLSGSEWSGLFHNRKKSGELYWESARISPIKNARGEITHFLAIKEDVTDRKQMLDDLAESENRLRSIAANLPGAVYQMEVDAAGNMHFAFVSEGIQALTGIRDEDLRRHSNLFFQVIHHEDLSAAVHAFEVSGRTGKPCSVEFRIEAGGGACKWIRNESMPQKIPDGLKVLYGVLLDITKQKQTEVSLREAQIKAESADRAKSEFLAMMSHEIRTPMNSILGFSKILMDSDLDSLSKEYLNIVHSNGEKLLALLNDILDLSKVEAGQLQFHLEPFDLEACVKEVVELNSHAGQAKGLKLKCQWNATIPHTLVGDMSRVRQILLNLIGNAVKFTMKGGVTVKVAPVPASQVLHTNPNAVWIEFTIEDTGIGIPASQIHLLFKPFSQIDSSRTRKFGGTGLGLSICKRLVDAMGGTIKVRSQENQGTQFSFQMPFQKLEHDGAKTVGVQDEEAAHDASFALRYPLDILVVDDEEINLKLFVIMLERLGYNPDMATDGKDALAKIKGRKYDIVLMDVQMPSLSGWDVTKEIRAMEKAGAIEHPLWVVALTAHAMKESRDRSSDAGMNDFLSKPLNEEYLAASLKKAFEMRKRT